MNKILVIIYILDFILIIISIINVVRANKCLSTRNQDLKELIEVKESNQELRFENYEYQDIFKEISKIVSESGQGTIVNRFNKIKEVIQSAKQNNF